MCPKYKKDFDAGVKAAYKLGFADGELQLEKTILLVKKTHRALFDELLRLDTARPVVFKDTIEIPVRTVRGIIKLCVKQKNFYMAKKLRALVKNQHGIEDKSLEKALKAEVTK